MKPGGRQGTWDQLNHGVCDPRCAGGHVFFLCDQHHRHARFFAGIEIEQGLNGFFLLWARHIELSDQQVRDLCREAQQGFGDRVEEGDLHRKGPLPVILLQRGH